MGKPSIADTSSSSSSYWVRGTCIGRGCFGAVSTAMSKSDGRVFAAKSVDLATCLPVQLESLENEIRVLRSLEPHPCIVKFLGDDVSKEGTTSYRNLHMEYLPRGTIADVASYGIDECLTRRYAWCLVSALRHVHLQGIVHCDVKSSNVLIGPHPCSVKLADFGSSIRFGKPVAPIGPRGSPLWMAPEVIRGEYQGPESDVWSLGCTVIEMFTGKPAWEDRGLDSLSQIGFSSDLPRFPTGLSELGRDFLEKCLNRDPRQRWRCEQLLQHPFLSRGNYSSSTDSSPRCVLDLVSLGFDDDDDEEEEEEEDQKLKSEPAISAMARICTLAATGGADWESDDWVEVRGNALEEEAGTSKEYSDLTGRRVSWEIESSEWQSCNNGKMEEVAVGSTVGQWWNGGYRCRCGPVNVHWVMLPCDLSLSRSGVVDNIRKYSVFVTVIIPLVIHRHRHRHRNNDNNTHMLIVYFMTGLRFVLLHVIN